MNSRVVTGERILLAHGSGGRATNSLIESVFRRAFSNPILDAMEDGATLPALAGTDLVIATDSHVVTPLFFPGGDIGSLSVNGTLNDVAMAGGVCRYLSATFIIEEGFPVDDLQRIAKSMAEAAADAGSFIVTGDTKVVERGKADGVFITTTGIGERIATTSLGSRNIRAEDCILVSGDIGRHGATITSLRKDMAFEADIRSDCSNLTPLVKAILESGANVRCFRDPTRGGVAAVLNEWADSTGLGVMVREADFAIHPTVDTLCELLGLDAFYLANEGRLLCVCEPADAVNLLALMRTHPLGADSAIVGRFSKESAGLVQVLTSFGGKRLLDWRFGDPLPRIC